MTPCRAWLNFAPAWKPSWSRWNRSRGGLRVSRPSARQLHHVSSVALPNRWRRLTRMSSRASLAPDRIVRFVYPLYGNLSRLGHDHQADDRERQAVLRARQTRSVAIMGPQQDAAGNRTLVAFAPVMRPVSSGSARVSLVVRGVAAGDNRPRLFACLGRPVGRRHSLSLCAAGTGTCGQAWRIALR